MTQLLQSAIVFGTVILFGALGEILTEKSGSLNLGVPGIMYLGGIAGLASAFAYESSTPDPNPLICLLLSLICAFLASMLGGLLFSFLTITLRANQNVTGLTLTIFGGGIANFFGGSLNKLAGGVGQISVAVTSGAYRTNIPALANLGWFGRIFLSHGFMVYLAIIMAIVLHWFLTRTRTGLNLRSIGESPATADAAGINVTRYKYLATCIGAGISGLGGLYYTMVYIKGSFPRAVLEARLDKLLQDLRSIPDTSLTSSIGLTYVQNDRTAYSERLRQADMALYHSKRSGKNRFCFYEDLPLQSGKPPLS